MIPTVLETILMSAQRKPEAMNSDSGEFHLTTKGWIRKDTAPYPEDRFETWRYEMIQPSGDKAQIRLTRVWAKADLSEAQSAALHARFGEAVTPSHERHVVLDCRN
jgi:hypothetical protein